MALRVLNRRGRRQQVADVSGLAFVGMLGLYPSDTPPTGWLVCDGSTFSAVTYPALAARLGGTTLPDFRGRTPVGVGPHADVNAVGATEGQAVANRRPSHVHAAGGTAHAHSTVHTHTAAAHIHTTSAGHAHLSTGHAHAAGSHAHTVSGSSGTATPGASADGVGAGNGTQTRNTLHTHGPGSLFGDANTPGNHTGYNNAAFGGITSTDNPGSTGSAAPATHSGGAATTSSDATGGGDANVVPFLAMNWIIRAA